MTERELIQELKKILMEMPHKKDLADYIKLRQKILDKKAWQKPFDRV